MTERIGTELPPYDPRGLQIAGRREWLDKSIEAAAKDPGIWYSIPVPARTTPESTAQSAKVRVADRMVQIAKRGDRIFIRVRITGNLDSPTPLSPSD